MKSRFLKTGFDSFEPHEVLEFILFYAIPKRDTNKLAHKLIENFGSIAGVLNAPYELLVKMREYSLNDLFQQEFGTNTDEVRKNIEEAIAYSQKREHSSKIKELMQKIKDVAAGIPGGIIANGICQLTQSIFS